MYLRHLLIVGALGSMLAACELPFGPSDGDNRVFGVVNDTVGRPVPGARIDILDGPRAGASTIAGYSGGFEFVSNATGAVRVRASRDGFEAATIDTVWQPPTSRQEIRLRLKTLEPAIIAPGAYTLTVTSDLSTATGHNGVPCTGFPADLRRRTYEATISHDARFDNLLVRFASPTLIKSPNQFGMILSVAGQFVGFETQNGWGSDWIEEFPGFRYLTIEGLAQASEPATSTETSITIPFWGSFEYCQLKSGLGGSYACRQVPAEQIIEYRLCSSKQDTMVFTKR